MYKTYTLYHHIQRVQKNFPHLLTWQHSLFCCSRYSQLCIIKTYMNFTVSGILRHLVSEI